MRVGLDFDNTIAGYDRVFAEAAVAEGLLPPGQAETKNAVKAALLEMPDGEERWMRLQGRAYGARMENAELIAGVADFLRRCRRLGVDVLIISHKTRFGHFDPDHVDLRESACAWMAARGFFADDGFGLPRDAVYFEATRSDKIARIGALGCDHFVDDLPEVLDDPAFPAATQRHLFAPAAAKGSRSYPVYADWPGISAAILGSGGSDG